MHESNKLQSASKQSLNQSFYEDMRGLDGLNDLTLQPIYSGPQVQPKEAASVVSLESLTYHAKSIFSCNNSMDDYRENGGPSMQDKNRERMDGLMLSMEKVASPHMSQRNSLDSSFDGSHPVRAFGSARNR